MKTVFEDLENSKRDAIMMSEFVQGEFYVQVPFGEIQDTMTDEHRAGTSRPI